MDIVFYSKYFFYVFLVSLFSVLVLPHLNREKKFVRNAVIFFVLCIGARYMVWRLFVTTMVAPMPTVAGFWVWTCFIGECIVLFESIIFYIVMLRDSDRKPQADRYETALRSMSISELPTVDVFIPTYNEEMEVVERTILGALHLDWPKEKLRVWVLDDGKRDWLRDFCAQKNAGYIRREKNVHAKAGNINHALEVTKGDYVAVFDADFVPHRQFLYRTLGFFADPKVGIVQTPQFFFNKDYVQSNLHLHDAFPDEQRIFFDMMMPARDAWDAAFWCGSCSVTRRRVLAEVGGVPTNSITEDLLTTLILLRKGYVTRYLNEKLSHGLAPESLTGLVIQRERWCRGTIQALYTRYGPFGPGLSFMHRLLFFPVHWIFSPLGRLFNFIVPMVFLWTGLPALIIPHYIHTIDYHVPFLILNFFVLFWLAPRHHIPLLNTAMLTLSSLHILPNMFHSLMFPNKRSFGVTPKGNTAKKKGGDRYSLVISCILFFGTLGGLAMHAMPWSSRYLDIGFFPIAAFWGAVNVLIAGIMIFLSIEHPRWRADERFPVNKKWGVRLKEGVEREMLVYDISMGGVGIQKTTDSEWRLDEKVAIMIPTVGSIKGIVGAIDESMIHIYFEVMSTTQRDSLIRFIFTGHHHNHTELTSYGDIFKKIFWRMFGNHDHIYIKKPVKIERDRRPPREL